jgi:hypothetical protein
MTVSGEKSRETGPCRAKFCLNTFHSCSQKVQIITFGSCHEYVVNSAILRTYQLPIARLSEEYYKKSDMSSSKSKIHKTGSGKSLISG